MNRELAGALRAPESVNNFLRLRGGVNLYGEPMYRLVWAPSRVVKQGGLWHDWDPNLSAAERGGQKCTFTERGGLIFPVAYRPRSITAEIRDVHKYHFEGWVVERWMPASMYGTEDEWLRYRVPGTSIPLLGPYPRQGDYEMAAGGEADREPPSLSRLGDAISACERYRARYRPTMQQVIRERVNEAEDAYRKLEEHRHRETLARLREGRRILYGTSLEAGRIREQIARRAGLREHVGN